MKDTDRRPIVVAVPDGDVDSLLRYAISEALIHGCGLRLVHVHRAGERERAERSLAGSVALAEILAGPGIPVTGSAVTGDPVAGVLAAAADARLVIIRQRDVLHLMRAIAGTGAPDPVTAVACVPTNWTVAPDDRRPVLVGVEDPVRSRALIARGLEIAAAHRTRLRVLHAWHLSGRYDALIGDRVGDQWNRDARSAIDDALAHCRHGADVDRVSVEVTVEHGTAAELLVDAARDAQVLVLERNAAETGVGVRLGRTARTALHGCPCPVLLLPTGRTRADMAASAVNRDHS